MDAEKRRDDQETEDAQALDLLRRFATEGDRESLSEFIVARQSTVYALACRFLGSPTDAEDVTQTVFMEVMRHAGEYARIRSLRGWLYTLTLKSCRQKNRAQFRRVRREQRFGMEQKRTMADAIHSPESPDGKLLTTELHEKIRVAVEALPAKYREAVLLRCFEGLSEREAAEILRTPEKTIRSRVARALKKLRENLIAGGVTLSSAALSASMAESPPPLAPPALSSALRRLAFDKSVATLSASVKAVAGFTKWQLGLAAVFAAACSAVCGAWYVRENQTPSADAVVSAVKEATPAPLVPKKSESFSLAADSYHHWDFRAPPALAEFKVTEGEWSWRAATETRPAALVPNPKVSFDFPFPITPKPYLLRLTVRRSNLAAKDGFVGVFYGKGGDSPRGDVYQKPQGARLASDAQYRFFFLFTENYIFVILGVEVSTIVKVERASDYCTVRLENFELESLEGGHVDLPPPDFRDAHAAFDKYAAEMIKVVNP